MARGTTFGTLHSSADLHLIQQTVKIGPAVPRTSYVQVPGADGSIDLTEALGAVNYDDRELAWTFALYPGDDWAERRRKVNNAINGIACHITPDEEAGWYYDGRVLVEEHATDKQLRTITVKAICRPWRYKLTPTTVARSDLGTAYKQLSLPNERRPVIPTITVEQATTLLWGGSTITLSAGTYRRADICLAAGANILKAKVASGAGTISVEYQEASL